MGFNLISEKFAYYLFIIPWLQLVRGCMNGLMPSPIISSLDKLKGRVIWNFASLPNQTYLIQVRRDSKTWNGFHRKETFKMCSGGALGTWLWTFGLYDTREIGGQCRHVDATWLEFLTLINVHYCQADLILIFTNAIQGIRGRRPYSWRVTFQPTCQLFSSSPEHHDCVWLGLALNFEGW